MYFSIKQNFTILSQSLAKKASRNVLFQCESVTKTMRNVFKGYRERTELKNRRTEIERQNIESERHQRIVVKEMEE